MHDRPLPASPPPPALTVDRVRADLAGAAKGDATALPTVRAMLRLPRFVDECGGDLARKAEDAVLDQLAGTNLLFREAVRRKAELLRAALGGPTPSPLEQIVADRVVMSWLQVHYAEAVLAQAKEWTVAQTDSWQRRIDRAHRRLLASAKALAQLRRLALPVVLAQVNVTAVPPRPELGQP